jgi:type II secretory pathway pseudopilin PulG
MRLPNQTKRRRGFTLIDMLVSTALVIFIMVILTQAYSAGMDSFRTLKALGDMEEKLRTAGSIVRKDLAADHFEFKKRLSEATFWNDGPPREGYFRIYQGAPSYPEGGWNNNTPPAPNFTDGDGYPSWVAPDPRVGIAGSHALQFTVKRRGNQRDQFASVGLFAYNAGPPASYQVDAASPLLTTNTGFTPDSRFQAIPAATTGIFASQWYEVAYFLADLGEQTPGGTKRYALYRQQRLLVTQNSAINAGTTPQGINPQGAVGPQQLVPVGKNNNTAQEYTEISTSTASIQGNMYFNSPADVTIPERRLGGALSTLSPISATWTPQMALQPVANPLYGSDILISDVISFDVRVLVPGQSDFVDLNTFTSNNTGLFAANAAVFDTWSKATDALYDYSTWSVPSTAKSLPLQLRIQAVQISIRVWDIRSQQARQITIVQDL